MGVFEEPRQLFFLIALQDVWKWHRSFFNFFFFYASLLGQHINVDKSWSTRLTTGATGGNELLEWEPGWWNSSLPLIGMDRGSGCGLEHVIGSASEVLLMHQFAGMARSQIAWNLPRTNPCTRDSCRNDACQLCEQMPIFVPTYDAKLFCFLWSF